MREILRRPVEGPGAWTSTQLAGDSSWIHELSREELGELDNATQHSQSSGLDTYRFGRQDFPLPSLKTRLARILHELEFGRGCVLIRGLDVNRYDADRLKRLYWGLGVHLGTPIYQNAKGDLIGHVTDGGRSYETKNVRGYTTRAAIRPHCDSSDIVGLLCLQASRSGGASRISSAMTIYNEILATRPEYLEALCSGYHFDLRSEGATGDPNEVTRNKVPVFSYYQGRLSCRYNQKTIEDGSAKSGDPLTSEQLAATRYVGELAARPDIQYSMQFEVGDIQILNNYSVLHARDAFEDDPSQGHKRELLRLWVNVPNGRVLAPEFADRLNTGPRGGVQLASNYARLVPVHD